LPVTASASPSGPGNGEDVFRYRLHSPDGDDLGEVTYAQMIRAGDEIHVRGGERLRLLEVVIFGDDDRMVGMLKLEPV
jgi:hypothetical protein